MGQVHNALDASLLGPAIREALGIRDGISTIERFSETLQPTLDLWRRPEFAALRGEKLWGCWDQVTAVAGENAGAGITNPSGSGMLLCVETWFGEATGNPAKFEWAIDTQATIEAALTSITNPFARDLRLRANTIGQSKAVARFCRGTNAGVVGTPVNAHIFSGQNGYVQHPLPLTFILPPGFGAAMWCGTVNYTVDFSITGWERKALRGELLQG